MVENFKSSDLKTPPRHLSIEANGQNKVGGFARPKQSNNQRTALIWIGATISLAILQFMSGNDPFYVTLIGLFVLLTGATLYVLGGLRTLLGLSVAIFAFQHIIVSQVAKVFFWQPADEALRAPLVTAAAYALSMFSLLAAAYARKFFVNEEAKPLLEVPKNIQRIFWMAVVCIIMAFIRRCLIAVTGLTEEGQANVGGVLGPLRTMIFLDPLAVALGTYYMVLKSNGKACVGWINAVPITVIVAFGILAAVRSDMATGVITLLITCWVVGFKFRPKHFITIVLLGAVAQFILFPYALYARRFVRTPDFATNVNLALDLVGQAVNNTSKVKVDDYISKERRHYFYYGRDIPVLDRYSVIVTSDAIIAAALRRGTTEMEMITPGFAMMLPRFLLPDKPVFSTSNMLAHRAPAMVNEDDFETQITMGMVCDAYTAFDWLGVVLIPFVTLFSFALIYTRVVGVIIKGNVLLASLLFSITWQFSENVISANILMIFQTPIILIVTYSFILFCADRIYLLTLKKN